MTPSQRDPALKPSVFPNLGRGLPAAASAGQPQAEPRHRAASLGSRALVADGPAGAGEAAGQTALRPLLGGSWLVPPVS